MQIFGRDVLYTKSHHQMPLRKWLLNWAAKVEKENWKSLDEVREAYPSADGVKLRSEIVVTVFNVKGNAYRLLTSIDYQLQVVAVLDVLTHAEYSKQAWKLRY